MEKQSPVKILNKATFERVGPIAGAKPITRPNMPIYLPRSCVKILKSLSSLKAS